MSKTSQEMRMRPADMKLLRESAQRRAKLAARMYAELIRNGYEDDLGALNLHYERLAWLRDEIGSYAAFKKVEGMIQVAEDKGKMPLHESKRLKMDVRDALYRSDRVRQALAVLCKWNGQAKAVPSATQNDYMPPERVSAFGTEYIRVDIVGKDATPVPQKEFVGYNYIYSQEDHRMLYPFVDGNPAETAFTHLEKIPVFAPVQKF